MNNSKVLTREQFERLPEALKQLVMGLQMHDADTLKYLLTLALISLHEHGELLHVTPELMEKVGGEGLVSLMIDDDPPRLDVAFLPGKPEQLFDRIVENRKKRGHSPDSSMPIDVRDVEKEKLQ